VESSDRNFTAFQNVAKAINGTAASSNDPAPTAPAGSGASSVHIGGAVFTVVAAALVAAFL
jgi:hypothetical protein